MAAGAGPVSGMDRTMSVLAYLGPLVVVPLLKRSKSRFLLYHTRQGLYLFGAAAAAVVVTLLLLFVFDRWLEVQAVFLVLSVVLLLEFIAYGLAVAILGVQAARSRMPMLPLLGDLAGEG